MKILSIYIDRVASLRIHKENAVVPIARRKNRKCQMLRPIYG